MKEQGKCPEYEKIFQGEPASLNIIRAEDEGLEITVNTLIKGGTVVGQRTMFDDDIILFMNPEKHYQKITPQTLQAGVESPIEVEDILFDSMRGGIMTR